MTKAELLQENEDLRQALRGFRDELDSLLDDDAEFGEDNDAVED